jgi:hypothetical protein
LPTGEVVWGTLAGEGSTVMGDAVNVAQRLEATAAVFAARAALTAGEPHVVEHASAESLELVGPGSPIEPYALAVTAQAWLHQREVERAGEAARRASETLRALGRVEHGEAYVRVTWAETLDAVGRTDEAREALGEARDRLLASAAAISVSPSTASVSGPPTLSK